MNEATMKPTIFVHGGVFHLDDVLCCAMGKLMGYRWSRTLDKEIGSKLGPADLLCDFGRRYDGVKFFDHHQSGIPLPQAIGLKARQPWVIWLSAAGMLWAAKGRDVVRAVDPAVPEECIQECLDIIDCSIISPSDRIDNGDEIPACVCPLSSMVSYGNPATLEEADKKFDWEVETVSVFLKDAITSTLRMIYGGKLIESSPIIDGNIIVLDTYVKGWQRYIKQPRYDNCLFIVYPSIRGGWSAQVLPAKGIGATGSRKLFPVEWIGWNEEKDMAKAMGLEYNPKCSYFVHEGRWIVSVPTKDEAIAVCRKAVMAPEN